MKNSTLVKGTAAIAVGAALLLGGGGTLAAWNAEASAAPGTIVAGDLNVTAATGVWTDRAGAVIADINAYKVVPGDKLTYTQALTVKLVGNKMAADVSLTGTDSANNFTADNVIISPLQLKNSDGTVASRLAPVAGSATQVVTASTSFEFKSATTGRSDINASYNLGNVKYTVQQVVAGQTGLS